MQEYAENYPKDQALILSAVHQARQPLLVLEYALFAATTLTQRLDTSPDVKLIQQSLSDMGAAVDSLALMISVIAGITRPASRKPTETVVSELVKEAFEMASFCLRRHQGAVNYELSQSITEPSSGMAMVDYPNALIALIRWILGAASCDEFQVGTGPSEPLMLTASRDERNLIIQVGNSRYQQQARLDQIVPEMANASNRTGE